MVMCMIYVTYNFFFIKPNILITYAEISKELYSEVTELETPLLDTIRITLCILARKNF